MPMSDVDPKAEAFYADAKRWPRELAALRRILRDSPMDEVWKWRSPCYVAADGNIATVWGLREAAALSFFKGVLLTDPDGLLAAPGDNSRSVRLMKFASVAEIEAAEAQIRTFIAEAIANEEAGRKVAFDKDDLPPPDELLDALRADSALKAAFDALTPGRQRGYVLHFSGAKQSSTRAARIARHAPRIKQGKGMHDR